MPQEVEMDTQNIYADWTQDSKHLRAEVARLRVDNDAAEGYIKQLTDWIIEADAAYNIDGKPAETLDDCLGLVRMCHEGAAALHKVDRLRAQVATLRRPLAVIYDLCQFSRDVGKGALLPPSLERDVLDALATTDNSGQDAR
jgi:hypothetical protein